MLFHLYAHATLRAKLGGRDARVAAIVEELLRLGAQPSTQVRERKQSRTARTQPGRKKIRSDIFLLTRSLR